MKKRLVIVLLIMATFSFGQSIENADSLLQGHWHLTKVELGEGYFQSPDFEPFTLQDLDSQSLIISADSLQIIFSESRFYFKNNKYRYELLEDSLFFDPELKIYQGKKKKTELADEFLIVKLNDSELVLRSWDRLESELIRETVTVYHTYRKDGDVPYPTDILNKTWLQCSENPISFLKDNDTLLYTYYAKEADTVECNSYRSELNFKRVNFENSMWISESSQVVGTYGSVPFRIDAKRMLLFVGKSKQKVFSIETLTDETLVLRALPDDATHD